MRNQEEKTKTMELTPSEQNLIEYIRDNGEDFTVGCINDVYAVATFHFPDYLPFHIYRNSFKTVYDLMHSITPMPHQVYGRPACEFE